MEVNLPSTSRIKTKANIQQSLAQVFQNGRAILKTVKADVKQNSPTVQL
jgi:hypothetical protein